MSEIEIIKNQIKSLSEQQRILRNQRKSVYIVGERTLTPYEAQTKHAYNRNILRCLYILYAEMRGKIRQDVEPNAESEPDSWYMRKAEKLITVGNEV